MNNPYPNTSFFISPNGTKFTIMDGTFKFIGNTNNINMDIDDCYPFIRFCHTWNFSSSCELNKPIVLCKNINCLILNFAFNQLIVLTTYLKSVKFGYSTTLCDAFPKNLISVEFGFFYNKNIKLTKKLITVYLNSFFNQPIEMSKNIEDIKLGKHFNHRLLLSKHLKYFTISCRFNHPIILPPTLKYLSITTVNTQKSFCIQHSIEEIDYTCILTMSNKYSITDNLPNDKSCCKIKCHVYDGNGKKSINSAKTEAEFLKCNLPSNITLHICD